MKLKRYYVYLMVNPANSVIYAGVTNNLIRRVFEHKCKFIEGFTKKYNTTKVVYWECFDDVKSAINREKQIKSGSRQKKIDLIIKHNPKFNDLYGDLL
ncbi:MAG: GIY-YIG nuclease family protein [Candidatus Berkelbacteria bacterium]|nr:GIY-YIG nuclease family protein [Candidatus Berkelbacteria bacterium]